VILLPFSRLITSFIQTNNPRAGTKRTRETTDSWSHSPEKKELKHESENISTLDQTISVSTSTDGFLKPSVKVESTPGTKTNNLKSLNDINKENKEDNDTREGSIVPENSPLAFISPRKYLIQNEQFRTPSTLRSFSQKMKERQELLRQQQEMEFSEKSSIENRTTEETAEEISAKITERILTREVVHHPSSTLPVFNPGKLSENSLLKSFGKGRRNNFVKMKISANKKKHYISSKNSKKFLVTYDGDYIEDEALMNNINMEEVEVADEEEVKKIFFFSFDLNRVGEFSKENSRGGAHVPF
jgi:hypothetical protein